MVLVIALASTTVYIELIIPNVYLCCVRGGCSGRILYIKKLLILLGLRAILTARK